MPLTDLLRSLDADAARELGAARAEQREQIDRLLSDAQDWAAVHGAEQVAAAEAEAHREAEGLLAVARAEARAETEAAVHAGLDRMEAAAAARLADLVGTAEGARATAALAAEALAVLPSAREVEVAAEHVEAVRSVAGARAVVPGPRVVGARVRDDDGRSVDNTAPVRLAAAVRAERTAAARRWRAG